MSHHSEQKGKKITLTIEKMITGGLSLGRYDGQAVFVPYGAPGDVVEVRIVKTSKRFVHGEIESIIEPGAERQEPLCPHFGRCGGCHLQHLSSGQALKAKQGFVEEALQRLGGVDTAVGEVIPSPQSSEYRSRAGLKVRAVKGHVLMGFYETNSHRIVDIESCPVMEPALNQLIAPLRTLISKLTITRQVAEIDLVRGDDSFGLVIHTMVAPRQKDFQLFKAFAETHAIDQFWLQRGKKRTLRPIIQKKLLSYGLDDGKRLSFLPGDFTQVNRAQNRQLVSMVMERAGSGERVWDLFCGVGNFSLSLADNFSSVTGVESYRPAVQRAVENSRVNGLDALTFHMANLSDAAQLAKLAWSEQDVVVLDPPREGAVAVAKALVDSPVKRVVYVSCDPATLARDAGVLQEGGYTLEEVVPLDMFPMAWHVESLALFTR
ncbi:MAG: 23S rRNA (uracil(1939)-C(5))-methyltransferase RlmD [Magnetococcales bacterium]|nr:23S rRNA (uracil(1939)-C(5))-methyltransferase RlmD [Magnetococcales bacterium]